MFTVTFNSTDLDGFLKGDFGGYVNADNTGVTINVDEAITFKTKEDADEWISIHKYAKNEKGDYEWRLGIFEVVKLPPKYIIAYYGTSGNGYVSYDENTCNSLDYAMTFYDKDEAEQHCAKLQKEWLSELRVEEV